MSGESPRGIMENAWGEPEGAKPAGAQVEVDPRRAKYAAVLADFSGTNEPGTGLLGRVKKGVKSVVERGKDKKDEIIQLAKDRRAQWEAEQAGMVGLNINKPSENARARTGEFFHSFSVKDTVSRIGKGMLSVEPSDQQQEQIANNLIAKIDRLRVFGVPASEFVYGALLGSGTRIITRSVLASVGLSGGLVAAAAVGGVVGGVKAGYKDINVQERERRVQAKDAGINRQELKGVIEKFKQADKRRLVGAVGRGSATGAIGAVIGAEVTEFLATSEVVHGFTADISNRVAVLKNVASQIKEHGFGSSGKPVPGFTREVSKVLRVDDTGAPTSADTLPFKNIYNSNPHLDMVASESLNLTGQSPLNVDSYSHLNVETTSPPITAQSSLETTADLPAPSGAYLLGNAPVMPVSSAEVTNNIKDIDTNNFSGSLDTTGMAGNGRLPSSFPLHELRSGEGYISAAPSPSPAPVNNIRQFVLPEKHHELPSSSYLQENLPKGSGVIDSHLTLDLASQPENVSLPSGSNPIQVTAGYLEQAFGRPPTNIEILEVTKEVCKQSNINVPNWGIIGDVDQLKIPPNYKLVFNDSVKGVIKGFIPGLKKAA